MNVQKVKNFWIKQSDSDWKVAKSLCKLGHYSHGLFFCHLSLEKLLKGIIVYKTKKQSTYSHDLLLLAKKAKVQVSKEQKEQLNEITTFNVRARYDDIKQKFHKKATKRYSAEYLEKSKKLRLWLKKYL
mgnify:CR=1 FL=1